MSRPSISPRSRIQSPSKVRLAPQKRPVAPSSILSRHTIQADSGFACDRVMKVTEGARLACCNLGTGDSRHVMDVPASVPVSEDPAHVGVLRLCRLYEVQQRKQVFLLGICAVLPVVL